ncbi:MAG TPA: type II toxin-antitoxin system Phd/YefM family antitoxin [Terriglobales bacterium]|nr:type II toxin-antitoxin system Phd/YefM family antitoxin [Terriglobales bacterium]
MKTNSKKAFWQLQTAKARFSEVFRLARSEGPQVVTRSGKEAVVILPEEQYDELIARKKQPDNLIEFFRKSPLCGANLDLTRDQDTGRDILL